MTLNLGVLILPMALAATLALAACGTGSSSGSGSGSGSVGPDVSGGEDMSDGTSISAPAVSGTPARGAGSAADIAFATGMIPHHAEGIVMADMALRQATDSKIKALVPKIKASHSREIPRMSGWLKGWGAPIPATGHGHHMSGMEEHMDAMMSPREMTDLGKASGSAFDRLWLQLMIRHHQGAVAMARTELAQGTSPEGKEFARKTIDGQTAEVAQMGSILTAIPG